MATKEEHLIPLLMEHVHRATSQGPLHAATFELIAEARAERDAAREELAKLQHRMPPEALCNSLAIELDFSCGVAVETLLRGALERLKAAQPVEGKFTVSAPFGWCMTDIDCSAPSNQWIEHTCRDRGDIEITFPNGRSVRLVRDVDAAQPESAPVVGGVTEAMLDELCNDWQQAHNLRDWLTSARDAIRKQKRVDVEAIRSLAMTYPPDGFIRPELLRAIGDEPDEPAEAPVNSPGIQDGSIAEAPLAEPAAPAQEQEGPWRFSRRDGDWGDSITNGELSLLLREDDSENEEHGKSIVTKLNEAEKLRARVAAPAQDGPFATWKSAFIDATTGHPSCIIGENFAYRATCQEQGSAERLVRLLNAGLEAPKLRARVAELEDADSRLRNDVTAWTHASNRHKARAVAAEARLRDREDSITALEAKLAALGENPIPRALGERHRDFFAKKGSWFAVLFEALLAGREPGVAS